MPRPSSLAAVLIVLLAGCASSQPEPCEPLADASGTGASLLPGTRIGIPYARRDDVELAFDIFRHAGHTARPTAVILRGGPATVGNRTSFVGQIVETFAEAGYQVVLPDYRSTSAAHAREDVVALLRTLGCHGRSLGVDPYRVVLASEHSGGDVALDVTSHLARLRRGRFAGQPAAPRASVVLGGLYANPPGRIEDATLLVHGAADREVPLEKAKALCATAGTAVPCEVHEVPDGIHRPENWTPAQWDYKERMIAWLGRHAGTPPPPSWPEDEHLRKRVVFDTEHGLTLDAHVPSGQGPFAAAVLVHGGGWEAGDRVTYITPMFAPLASADVAWFSIDYRLTPAVANEEQVRDVRQAVAHIREHAARYRVDPRRIVLVGESASGQIVAQLATEGIDVAGVVSFYGVYDLEVMAGDPASPRSLARRLFNLSILDEEGRARIRRQSPLHQVHARMPPMLLVTGTKDGLWAQAQAFEQALARVGARHATIVLPDAPHGMEQWDSDPRWEGWDARVLAWMLEVTSAATPRP